MTASELCEIAESFANAKTCYLKGFWMQFLSESEYSRILRMYPVNSKYGNEKYIGDPDMYPADCICFVKGILGGAKPGKRITYAQMAANPVGDCTNVSFKAKLKNRCMPSEAKAGYGLASDKHCGIALGNGTWIDCNFDGIQNGVKIHTSGIGVFDVAGEIPGVDYSEQEDEVKDFLMWLYAEYKKSRKEVLL